MTGPQPHRHPQVARLMVDISQEISHSAALALAVNRAAGLLNLGMTPATVAAGLTDRLGGHQCARGYLRDLEAQLCMGLGLIAMQIELDECTHPTTPTTPRKKP